MRAALDPPPRGRVHHGSLRDELLTTRRFARLCRLSVKQLRHYDETGLPAPARVDPASGYRCHAPGHEVTWGREPERRLAVVRARCTAAGIADGMGDCVGRLLPALGAAGTAWKPPPRGLYPLDVAGRMEIAAGVQADADPPPGPELLAPPRGPVAETVHVRSVQPAHRGLPCPFRRVPRAGAWPPRARCTRRTRPDRHTPRPGS
ncbi:hypothetical protein [Streptomyces sp. KD18]|uniref:hypothetical protein n=1 Tax=Streptomyces sp. KD18 TaxID=2773452 RepID=UPI00295E3094|nr:hypothetical protein [Streptomyces sp. KD18]